MKSIGPKNLGGRDLQDRHYSDAQMEAKAKATIKASLAAQTKKQATVAASRKGQ